MYLYDRVCETSTTTGTGTVTLAGAVTGFRTFNSSGAAAGNDFHYLIEAVDANGNPTGAWEIGIGNCPSTTTVARLIVTQSSNAGAAVSFAAGTKRVHLISSALQLGWQGAYASISSDLTAQNYTTSTAITWTGGTNPDTDAAFNVGFWSSGANTKIKFPATGYDQTKAVWSAQVGLSALTAGEWAELKFRLNGSTTFAKNRYHLTTTATTIQIQSPITTLGFNDYVEVMLQIQTDTSITVVAADSWFQMEIRQ